MGVFQVFKIVQMIPNRATHHRCFALIIHKTVNIIWKMFHKVVYKTRDMLRTQLKKLIAIFPRGSTLDVPLFFNAFWTLNYYVALWPHDFLSYLTYWSSFILPQRSLWLRSWFSRPKPKFYFWQVYKWHWFWVRNKF